MGELAPSVVAEVRPPFFANEAGLLVEKLPVEARHLGHYLALPFPKRPVPPSIGEDYITTVLIDNLLCREATNSAVEQGQEANLVNQFH